MIFINGFNTGDGGTAHYWRTYEKRQTGTWNDHDDNHNYSGPVYGMVETYAFDTKVMEHFNDGNSLYRDGALGSGVTASNLFSTDRESWGKSQGQIDAKTIIANLARDPSSNIIESIKIVSHSMGGAYAKGYIKALVEYVKANPKLAQGLSITEYDFAAFQQNKLSAVDGVPLFQFDNEGDEVVGGIVGKATGSHHAKEKGREENGSNDNVNPDGGHSIMDFKQAIQGLTEGTYKFIDGQFVKQ